MAIGPFPEANLPGLGANYPHTSNVDVKRESGFVPLVHICPFITSSRVNFAFIFAFYRNVDTSRSAIKSKNWCINICLIINRYIATSSRYSDCLRAGRSGDGIPVGVRFSAPVQTGREAHPASCRVGTGSFPGVKCGRGVTLSPHPLLVPRSKIE
jgi:hypothetical protein